MSQESDCKRSGEGKYYTGINKYKFNGKELQDELGLNVYAMDMRQYDPTIARWTVQDPVIHHDMSPYNAFNCNPIFWADPSGTEGEHYNWDTKKYENNKGKEVSFETALASQGLSADGSDKSTENDDIINVDSKSKKASVIKTNDNFDKVSTDGGAEIKTEKGVTQKNLESQGYSIFNPEGAGMAVTDFGLMFASGEMIFAKLSIGIATWWAARGAGKIGTTVLGHYPQYVVLAEKLAANRFQIPPSIWNKMTAGEQWIANTKFLDRMMMRGDNIRLATPLNQVKPGSFFERELNYLFSKGYQVGSNGTSLIK